MGDGPVQHTGDPGELDDSSEPVGVPRGSVCGGRHRQAATPGGQEVHQHRQVVGEDHDQGTGDDQRQTMLHLR